MSFTLDTETEIADTRIAFLDLADNSVLEPEGLFGGEGAAWSPVGSRLAYVRHTLHANIVVVDLDAGSSISIPLDDLDEIASLRWSPGGDQLIFGGSLQNSVDFDIFVLDLDALTRTAIAATPGIQATPDWRQ